MILYLLNSTATKWLTLLPELLKVEDSILFLEDGVYNLMRYKLETNQSIYALKLDIQARGIEAKIPPNIQQITYNEFVYLTIKHKKIITL